MTGSDGYILVKFLWLYRFSQELTVKCHYYKYENKKVRILQHLIFINSLETHHKVLR